LNDCSHICIDGWQPVLSYTCACYSGYTLEADRRTCSIDKMIALVTGPIILLVIIFLVVIFVVSMYFLSPLHSLPREISWSFFDKVLGLNIIIFVIFHFFKFKDALSFFKNSLIYNGNRIENRVNSRNMRGILKCNVKIFNFSIIDLFR
jgi:hypothetical protein